MFRRLYPLVLALPLLGACGSKVDEVAASREEARRSVPAERETCAQILENPRYKDLRIDPARSGTFTSADGKLRVNMTVVDRGTISFTSNIGVDAVVMKGPFPLANLYDFGGGEGRMGTTLMSPGKTPIDWVLFCYDIVPGEPPPTGTPPTPPSTPPTEEPPQEEPEEPCDDGEC